MGVCWQSVCAPECFSVCAALSLSDVCVCVCARFNEKTFIFQVLWPDGSAKHLPVVFAAFCKQYNRVKQTSGGSETYSNQIQIQTPVWKQHEIKSTTGTLNALIVYYVFPTPQLPFYFYHRNVLGCYIKDIIKPKVTLQILCESEIFGIKKDWLQRVGEYWGGVLSEDVFAC